MTSHRSLVWPGCVRKLMLLMSGLEPVKFRIVQLPSIWICEGAGLTTVPSITPPKSATQSSACAGAAVRSDTAKVHSRMPIQLSPPLTRFAPRDVMYALVPIPQLVGRVPLDPASRRVRLDLALQRIGRRGPRQSTQWTEFRRSRCHRALDGPLDR